MLADLAGDLAQTAQSRQRRPSRGGCPPLGFANHQLSHRCRTALEVCVRPGFGGVGKSAGSASPKVWPNADWVKAGVARTEASRQEVLNQANIQANKLIEEAQAAAHGAGTGNCKRPSPRRADHCQGSAEIPCRGQNRMLIELRREVGRLVVDTTTKVTGKILTPEDQKRLADETSRQLAA